MNHEVFISIGSNMGDRENHLRKAMEHISALPQTVLTGVSNIYETEPVGVTEQNCFLNMCISVGTGLEPLVLLKELQRIENALKRVRSIRWGPRTIDLDILLYDDLSLNLPELTVPHPRMLERAFVLVPLCDIMHAHKQDLLGKIEKCSDKDGVRRYRKLKLENGTAVGNT